MICRSTFNDCQTKNGSDMCENLSIVMWTSIIRDFLSIQRHLWYNANTLRSPPASLKILVVRPYFQTTPSPVTQIPSPKCQLTVLIGSKEPSSSKPHIRSVPAIIFQVSLKFSIFLLQRLIMLRKSASTPSCNTTESSKLTFGIMNQTTKAPTVQIALAIKNSTCCPLTLSSYPAKTCVKTVVPMAAPALPTAAAKPKKWPLNAVGKLSDATKKLQSPGPTERKD